MTMAVNSAARVSSCGELANIVSLSGPKQSSQLRAKVRSLALIRYYSYFTLTSTGKHILRTVSSLVRAGQ